jgi:hypothetical protein
MWPIKINGQLLDRLIGERFPGGLGEFQAAWPADGGPNRTTIYRWRKGGLPKSRDDFLTLAGVLDVDPFCLLTNGDNTLPYLIDRITATREERTAVDHPALRFIEQFMGRKKFWPPQNLLERFYEDFEWHIGQFEHSAQAHRNYYETLELSGDSGLATSHPQTFHFAFRHPTLFGERWLQYGYVVREGIGVRLVHINGYSETSVATQQIDPTYVETFFGEGPAIFRVASIHHFSLRLLGANDNLGGSVRFPG